MSENETKQEQPKFTEIENVRDLPVDKIRDAVKEYAKKNSRFITMTCLDKGDDIEVYYHFDDNLEISHLRTLVNKKAELPSVSDIYFCAFLIENEIKELFGLNVTGLVIDYQGKLLMSDETCKMPMLKSSKV